MRPAQVDSFESKPAGSNLGTLGTFSNDDTVFAFVVAHADVRLNADQSELLQLSVQHNHCGAGRVGIEVNWLIILSSVYSLLQFELVFMCSFKFSRTA